ncbi:MAG TPA: hypothetical protein VMQ65_06120 [Candidatus Limnocylindria bacterium]|nr:hypothetical protein [Candidatus Limnocylindria bacterium]
MTSECTADLLAQDSEFGRHCDRTETLLETHTGVGLRRLGDGRIVERSQHVVAGFGRPFEERRHGVKEHRDVVCDRALPPRFVKGLAADRLQPALED